MFFNVFGCCNPHPSPEIEKVSCLKKWSSNFWSMTMTSSLSLPCISIYFWSQHLKKHGLKAALLHCCHGHNFTTDVKNVSMAEVGGKRTVPYVGRVRGGGIQSNHGTPQCHPSSKKSGLAKALLSDHGDKKSPWMNFVSKGFFTSWNLKIPLLGKGETFYKIPILGVPCWFPKLYWIKQTIMGI